MHLPGAKYDKYLLHMKADGIRFQFSNSVSMLLRMVIVIILIVDI